MLRLRYSFQKQVYYIGITDMKILKKKNVPTIVVSYLHYLNMVKIYFFNGDKYYYYITQLNRFFVFRTILYYSLQICTEHLCFICIHLQSLTPSYNHQPELNIVTCTTVCFVPYCFS